MALVNLNELKTNRTGFTDFIRKVDTEEKAFSLFAQTRLLNYNRSVCECGSRFLLKNTDKLMPAGFRWRCLDKSHVKEKKFNPLLNTWFKNMKITFLQNFELILHWLFKLDTALTVVDTKSAVQTVVDWKSFMREVCCVANKNSMKKIGGPGHFVEVDESHLFRRKYNRGKRVKGESIWVLGGIDRTTKERFLVRIKNRKKITMWPVLKKYIAPGSIVVTDDHRSYRGIKNFLQLSEHEVVVHRYSFNNPLFPDICTNTIECIWGKLKKLVKRSGSDASVDQYIGEYVYRSNLQLEFGSRNYGLKVFTFLEDIRKTYPGPHRKIYK